MCNFPKIVAYDLLHGIAFREPRKTKTSSEEFMSAGTIYRNKLAIKVSNNVSLVYGNIVLCVNL